MAQAVQVSNLAIASFGAHADYLQQGTLRRPTGHNKRPFHQDKYKFSFYVDDLINHKTTIMT